MSPTRPGRAVFSRRSAPVCFGLQRRVCGVEWWSPASAAPLCVCVAPFRLQLFQFLHPIPPSRLRCRLTHHECLFTVLYIGLTGEEDEGVDWGGLYRYEPPALWGRTSRSA